MYLMTQGSWRSKVRMVSMLSQRASTGNMHSPMMMIPVGEKRWVESGGGV